MRGLGHPLVQRNLYTTWIGPTMGAELVELPGGHPQLQDRKLALGPDRGPVAGGGYSRAVRAAPRLSVKSCAELALHLAGGAEFRQPLGDGS